jgi:hypothetical protein
MRVSGWLGPRTRSLLQQVDAAQFLCPLVALVWGLNAAAVEESVRWPAKRVRLRAVRQVERALPRTGRRAAGDVIVIGPAIAGQLIAELAHGSND